MMKESKEGAEKWGASWLPMSLCTRPGWHGAGGRGVGRVRACWDGQGGKDGRAMYIPLVVGRVRAGVGTGRKRREGIEGGQKLAAGGKGCQGVGESMRASKGKEEDRQGKKG